MGSEGVRSRGWDKFGDGDNGELCARGEVLCGEVVMGNKSVTWQREEQAWGVGMNALQGATA